MVTFTLSLARRILRVQCRYESTLRFCGAYLAPDDPEPEAVITVTQEDIARERTGETRFSDQYLETLALYRKITEVLAFRQTVLMHGAVIAVGDSAYMFTAPSGTGKSTHIKFWLEKIPGSYVLNGDKPLLILEDRQVLVCGTPWQGKEGLGTDKILPLKAIVLLHRGDTDEICPVSPSEALVPVLQQLQRPADPEGAAAAFSRLQQLMENVRFFSLSCTLNPGSALISYEALRNL